MVDLRHECGLVYATYQNPSRPNDLESAMRKLSCSSLSLNTKIQNIQMILENIYYFIPQWLIFLMTVSDYELLEYLQWKKILRIGNFYFFLRTKVHLLLLSIEVYLTTQNPPCSFARTFHKKDLKEIFLEFVKTDKSILHFCHLEVHFCLYFRWPLSTIFFRMCTVLGWKTSYISKHK